MAWFLLIIVIIAFIVYANDKSFMLKRLKKENEQLREIIKTLQGTKTQTQETVNQSAIKEQIVKPVQVESVPNEAKEEVKVQETEEEKAQKKLEKERVEREKKNTNILVVGAILIVLAAVVFLMSTWNSIGSLLKAIVLGLFVFIFLGMSKAAKEKYNLPKAGTAFFYIAMAYIPICLISFSVFGLVGNYFSLEGEGKYIYYAVSFIITSSIYYFNYKKLNSKILFAGTIASQLLSIVLFLLTFENNGFIILAALLGYNLILLKMNFSKDEFEFIKVLNVAIPYISAIVLLLTFMEVSNWKLLCMILLAVNLYFNKIKNELNLYLLNADIYALSLYIPFFHFELLNDAISIIIATGLIIIVFLCEYLFVAKENKNFRQSGLLLGMISILIVLFKSLIVHGDPFILKPYIFLIIEMVFMILIYKDDLWKEAGQIAIPIIFIATCLDIVYEHINTTLAYFILGIIVFVLYELISTKNNNFKNKLEIIGNAFVSLMFVSVAILDKEAVNIYFYIVSLLLINVYNYLKFKGLHREDLLLAYPLLMPLVCISIINPEAKTIIFACIAILVTYAALIRKKISVETFVAGLYLVIVIEEFKNEYIQYMILIIWSIINMFFVQSAKEKDVFKALAYTLVYLIYRQFLTDFVSTEYKVFELTGILVLVVTITRTILKNYIKDIDAIEYIALGLMYLSAIGQYYNEFDGMMFVAVIVILMFISYYKKYGAIFVVSLFAILANAILLTREFWLAIPWWIYLLAVGSLLILFAVKNESDEKKFKNINPQSIIKNLKEKIENDK